MVASKIVLPKEVEVTRLRTIAHFGVQARGSILEYAEALRNRYHGASKKGKGKMLDEFTQVAGLRRKAAIRLLNRQGQPVAGKRRGRKRKYGTGVTEALRVVWEASDRLCSRRLKPFLPEMVKILRRHGEQQIDDAMEAQLCLISPTTIDRLLKPHRRLGGRRGLTTTAAYYCLERLYASVRLYTNFFQPAMKLVSKTRYGAKVNKVYDTARTPYQRLLEAGALTESKTKELAATYHNLNPVHLLKQVNDNLESLWGLAVHPVSLGNRNYESTRRSWVTVYFDAIRT
jgi:hypothetical protein